MKLTEKLAKGHLVIFLFHGVIERTKYSVRNYIKKHVEKDCFYQLLNDLRKVGKPLSMDEAVEHYKTGKPFPPKAFAVTFDDGFENNYSLAAPILKELDIPATFYVTTDFIENNHMSWIDRIEYCLEAVSKGQLFFPGDKTKRSFNSTEDKIRLLEYLRSHVKQDPAIDQELLVKSVFSQCGLQEVEQSNEPLDLKMNWGQIKELNDDVNFIIGGHSHHHVNLAFLNDNELKKEIKTSVDIIKKRIGLTIRHYSYPEGLSYCYSEKVIEMLQEKGIVCCPSAEDGINDISTDLFHLKRVMVVP